VTVIHEFVSANAKGAIARGLTFEVKEAAEMNSIGLGVPRASFATVVEKLLKNAMRFSDQNSTIGIEMEVLWRPPDEELDGVIIMDWQDQAQKTIDEYKSLIESPGDRSRSEDTCAQDHQPDRDVEPQFVMRITDTGIGIPGQDLRFIGEPFRQASNSPDQSVKGKALGLSLVQKILADCRGHLCCKSVEGVTTTFSIFLPVARAYTSTPDPQEEM
jgi:signal transduction histidine kinase